MPAPLPEHLVSPRVADAALKPVSNVAEFDFTDHGDELCEEVEAGVGAGLRLIDADFDVLAEDELKEGGGEHDGDAGEGWGAEEEVKEDEADKDLDESRPPHVGPLEEADPCGADVDC